MKVCIDKVDFRILKNSVAQIVVQIYRGGSFMYSSRDLRRMMPEEEGERWSVSMVVVENMNHDVVEV